MFYSARSTGRRLMPNQQRNSLLLGTDRIHITLFAECLLLSNRLTTGLGRLNHREATNMYSEEAFCDPSLSPADNVTHLVHLIDLVLQHLPAHASQASMAEALRDAIYAMID
ncbi:hypothetical protein X801_03848 [Opisthorchis viverrini]|uniref:Uncharacterized protein n=1 Tax=Opisthorchis viverrini TaxID=6198 RepID=A0A1S8X194_OPIVI|nr:hypothetical protein X801_03848 [Opisthorchis viverrini]